MDRSVKRALASLSVERKPSVEVLLVTLLIEKESVMISRSLTHMPIEAAKH